MKVLDVAFGRFAAVAARGAHRPGARPSRHQKHL